MANNRFTKDPDATKDYHFDWRDWLLDGDSIASFEILSAVLTVGSGDKAPSEQDGVVTVWLSGGTVDNSATVTCRIVTAEGREDDKTMYFQIKPE